MALGTDPHAGACWGSSLPIRGRARAGRRGVAQGAQAGGVCAPETTRSTGLATGTLLLYGGHLATVGGEFSANLTPPIGNANNGEVSPEEIPSILWSDFS